LIARGREAQWRPCRLEAGPLKDVSNWVEKDRRFWEESFDRPDVWRRRNMPASHAKASDAELAIARLFDAA
jgi:hypothetical protein